MSISMEAQNEATVGVVTPLLDPSKRSGSVSRIEPAGKPDSTGSAVVGIAWGTIISLPIWAALVLSGRLLVRWL